MKSQRKFKNFLIRPLLQFKISGFFLIQMLLLFALLIAFSHSYWSDTMLIMVEMSGIPQEATQFIENEVFGFLVQLGMILFLFLVIFVAFVIQQTHRFLGASYAIKKHVEEKMLQLDYSEDIKVRDSDYLQDVAETLNKYIQKKRA